MSHNLYSDPEKFGLRTIGEIDWDGETYGFNLTVVWQDTTTRALYYADDSGCSCPTPFEDTGRDDLILIDRTQALIDHLDARIADMADGWRGDGWAEQARAEAGELIQKVRGVAR